MSIDNDQFLNEILDAENKKIPSMFKLSKLTARIAIASIVVFFLLTIMFIVFFYNSGNEMVQQSDSAYSMAVNMYNSDYIKYAVICLAVVIVVAFWLFMVQYYERRAYVKASDFANKLHYAEMQRKEEKLAEERFAFRPKMTPAEDPAFWTMKKPGK